MLKKLLKLFLLISLTIIILADAGYPQREKNDKVKLPLFKGNYLGQKPPGLKPTIFAPGIISTNVCEMCIWFTPGRKEVYFVRGRRPNRAILYMKVENGLWAAPQVVPFSGKYDDGEFGLSYDGNKMAIASMRPSDKENKVMGFVDIWITTRNGNEWRKPINPGHPINTKGKDIYPTFSKTGDLYFTSDRDGFSHIYLSRHINREYSPPVKLGGSINSEYHDFDAVIAPDDNYMIFCSSGRPDSYGSSDLYVSFRKQDGSWSRAKNLGKTINTSYGAYCPSISPDGKYIFFQNKRTGNGDIYWVDARAIKVGRGSVN